MESIYRLAATVRLVDMFTGPMRGARSHLQRFTRELRLADRGLKLFRRSMAVVGVAAALGLGLTAGAEAAGTFETSLKRLSLISQASAKDLAALRAKALDLGVLTEWSPNEAVAGMTALASAGYRVQDQLRLIKPTLDFATAGIGDLATSAKLIDSVLKAYSITADQAGQVTDKLARLTQIASVEMNELATAIPVVSAAGSQANQTLSDTLALLGAIRPAAQSTQDAAQIFNSLAEAVKAPTRRMQQIIKRDFGLNLNELFRAEGGKGAVLPLVDIIENLERATAKMTDAQRSLFLKQALNATGAKAYDAVLKMTYKTMRDGRLVTLQGVEAVRAMSEALDGSTGTTKTFAAEMMQTWEGVKKMLAGTLETFAIVLGMGPLQVIQAIISAITRLLNPILAWMQRHERLVKIIGASVTAVVALAAGLGILSGALGLAMLLAAKWGAALKLLPARLGALKAGFLSAATGAWSFTAALLANPVTWIVIGLVALGAVLVWLYKRFDWFRGAVDGLWARLKSFWMGLEAGFSYALKPVWEALEPIVNLFKRFVKWLGLTSDEAQKGPVYFLDWIEVGRVVGQVLGGLIRWLFDLMTLPYQIGAAIWDAIQSVWDWFKGLNLFEAGARLWQTFVDGIKSKLSAPLKLIKAGLAKIRKLLPFSDAKEGPLSNLTASGMAIPETMARGIRAAAPALRLATLDALGGMDLGRLAVAPVEVDIPAPRLPALDTLGGVDLGRLTIAPPKVDLPELWSQAQARRPDRSPDGVAPRVQERRAIHIHNLTINVDADDLQDARRIADLFVNLAGAEAVA